jgi:hypothetical protein
VKSAAAFVAFYLFLGTGAALALDGDWTATLSQPDDGSAYAPAEELSVAVPEDVPYEELLRLGLEVDAIDVTPLLAFENQTFTYRPARALSPGEHTVRLIQISPDGEILERGNWTIEVSGGTAIIAESATRGSTASLSATNSVEFSQRLAEKGIENAPSRGQVSGGGYGDLSISDGAWSFVSNGNYLIQSQEDRAPSGNKVDLGEFSLNSRYDGEDLFGQVAVGHQSLGTNNFIMSGFNRRGVSASLGSSNEMASVTGFGFNPESITGGDNFTGLNDGDNRLLGFQATAHPVPGWGKDFSVSSIYYTGKGTDSGTGIAGDSNTNEGDGWGLTADRYLFDRSLQITGQYAHTSFDQGGVVLDDGKDEGDAWSLALAYSPFQGEEVAGEYMNLTLGARYERVDTFFSSLANASLAADRDGLLLYSDLYWGNFTANAQGLYQTNNVDDLSGVPTDRLMTFQFSGNYYPTVEPPAEGETDWLGQPYLSFDAGTAENKRKDTPEGYLGTTTDNKNISYTLGGGSTYNVWGWQLSETYSRFEDRSGNASDTDSYLTDFSTNWIVSDAVQLTSGLQWGLFKDRGTNDSVHTVNLNLGIQAEIIPETLKTSLNYNLNLLTGDGDTPDNTVANGEIEWTILPPEENNIGVALAFQGLLENRNGNDDSSFDGTDWQIYSVLRISAPVSY